MDDEQQDHARLRAALAAAQAIAAAGDTAYDWDLRSDKVTWSGRTSTLFRDGDLPASGSDFRTRIVPDDQAQRSKELQALSTQIRNVPWFPKIEMSTLGARRRRKAVMGR